MRNTLDSIARRNDRRQREMLRLALLTPVMESTNTAPTQRAVLAMAHARKTVTRAGLLTRIARPEAF